MNFQTTYTPNLLKVLVVNPLAPTAQLIIVKLLSGAVFGENQLLEIILLVYSNERKTAESLKFELNRCAFPCCNSIEVSSDLPSVSDADVFCFITNFSNPNFVDINKSDNDEQFDTLYLIIKIAHNLSGLIDAKSHEKKNDIDDVHKSNKLDKIRKPIFIADGLVAIDILKSLSKDLPPDVFYCPSALPTIAKSVLAEHLKVQCNTINDVFVWAANDEEFHIEFEKPLIIHDNVHDEAVCDWDVISKKMLNTVNLDHTQFSASWIKKDFIKKVGSLENLNVITTSRENCTVKGNIFLRKYNEKIISSDILKVASIASKNPYGCIYRAAEFAKTLREIWLTYSCDEGTKICSNVGIISDGSLGTIKGYPYILPLILNNGSWRVNTNFEEDTHLKSDIKRINKVVKDYHQKLIPYCKRFLEENVIRQAFIPVEEETITSISETTTDDTSRQYL